MRSLALSSMLFVAAASPMVAQLPSLTLDASVGARSGAQRAAISAWHPVVNAGRLQLGVGARVSAYAGDPADYTNRGTVLGSLNPTLSIDPSVYGLNGAVFGELGLVGRLAVGANLDLVGIATGPTRNVGVLEEKPQPGSYFAGGSGDHGALNSEFYVALGVAPRVRVRGGLSHFVTNYTVTDRGSAGSPSSRYQKFQTVLFVAAGLRL